MPKINLYTYAVEGRGHFPIDMLRYDMCWPDSEEDANTLYESTLKVAIPRCKIQLSGFRPPTIDRWISLKWIVVPESIKPWTLDD